MTPLDLLLHPDHYLVQLFAAHGAWLYGILFAIIFAETGFVVTPFLPGDSLLFGAGALAAAAPAGTGSTLALPWLVLALSGAAVLGNTLNYSIGRALGQAAAHGHYRFIKLEYVRRTEAYFQRHGGLAVVVSRFMPIVRTFAPLVAGIARMNAWRFQLFNITGGVAWIASFLLGGYWFGNLPWVKGHFGLVTLAVIGVSLLPIVIAWARDARARS